MRTMATCIFHWLSGHELGRPGAETVAQTDSAEDRHDDEEDGERRPVETAAAPPHHRQRRSGEKQQDRQHDATDLNDLGDALLFAVFALPVLGDVDKAPGLHHLVARDPNDDPRLPGVERVSDRVLEDKCPVAAFRQLRRIGRHLLEAFGVEAEIGADGRDGDRARLLLL